MRIFSQCPGKKPRSSWKRQKSFGQYTSIFERKVEQYLNKRVGYEFPYDDIYRLYDYIME
jgi:hypothetical protein